MKTGHIEKKEAAVTRRGRSSRPRETEFFRPTHARCSAKAKNVAYGAKLQEAPCCPAARELIFAFFLDDAASTHLSVCPGADSSLYVPTSFETQPHLLSSASAWPARNGRQCLPKLKKRLSSGALFFFQNRISLRLSLALLSTLYTTVVHCSSHFNLHIPYIQRSFDIVLTSTLYRYYVTSNPCHCCRLCRH